LEIDKDRIDDYTLALLYLVVWKRQKGLGARVWKSFDWETMDRLHEKGYISDPQSKAKSVVLYEDAFQRAEQLFEKFFAV